MSISHLLTSFLIGALSSALLAADVLVVRDDGGGDFVSLEAAVLAAQDGDVLLLHGDFATETPTLIGKSLVFVAEAGERPIVGGLGISGIPQGGTVVVRGLSIGPKPERGPLPFMGSLAIGSSQGSILVEDCVIEGLDGDPTSSSTTWGESAVAIGSSTGVVFTRCTMVGGDAATFEGSTLLVPVGKPGSGLEFDFSGVHVFASTVIGGAGAMRWNDFPGSDGAPGLRGSGRLLLEGGLVQGGPGGTDCVVPGVGCGGGAGVVIEPGFFGSESHMRRRGALAQGGAGGQLAPPSTGTGDAGADLDVDAVLIEFPGAPTFMVSEAPLRTGEHGSITVHGAPGANVAWVMSLALDANLLPGSKGVLVPDLPLLGPHLLGTIPPSGEVVFQFVNPSIARMGLDALLIGKQALVLDGDGLRFGGPSGFVHLGTTP
ncbi:MAG: hypothetical protein DHS20C15_30130 [Planctomycetota bacterium]|nr:MAG: hypothetical protein DHS20C15_30130 [Planctomycetota bacterium]